MKLIQQRQLHILLFASTISRISIKCFASTTSSPSESAASLKTLDQTSDQREIIHHNSPFLLPGFSGSSSSSDDSDEGNDSLPSEEAPEEEEEDNDHDNDDEEEGQGDEHDYDDGDDTDYQQLHIKTSEDANGSAIVENSGGDRDTTSSKNANSSGDSSIPNVSKVSSDGVSGKNQSISETDGSSSSKPLRTLKKLQAMLEDTDYATATATSNQQHSTMKQNIQSSKESISSETSNRNVQEPIRENKGEEEEGEEGNKVNRLWTSKDRSKYKYQQRKLQRERQRYLEQQQYQQHVPSDDDSTTADITDGTEDTDDGLGYTLPNLPIYMSDGESTETDEIEFDDGGTSPPKPNTPPLAPPPPLPSIQKSFHQYPPSEPRFPPEQQGQGPPYRYQYQNNHMQTSYPQQQQQIQQPYQYSQGSYNPYPYPPHNQYLYNDPNAYNNINVPPPRYGMPPLPPPPPQQQQQQYGQWPQTYPIAQYIPQNQYTGMSRTTFSPQPQLTAPQTSIENIQNLSPSSLKVLDTIQNVDPNQVDIGTNVSGNIRLPQGSASEEPVQNRKPVLIRDTEGGITFDSLQKLVFFMTGIFIMSYAAVSPRTLDRLQYNVQFRKSLYRLFMAFVPSLGYLIVVMERERNNLNTLIGTFYASATLGFSLAFILEIVVTTLIRLAVFVIWEPSVFSLTPDVPLIILPWALRENNYRPKRITLLVADLIATCLAAPLIEEYVKLKVVQLVTKLPRNFIRKKKESVTSGKKKKKNGRKKYVLEAVDRQPGEEEVTNINSYVTHLMAASMGMKFCDTTRRVLVYNRHSNVNKNFYSLFRGFYPIQDLCGVMTALELAKRDVLGLNIPTWKLVLPAAFVHSVANLKGKKPIFKFNSSAPWTELGLWVPGSIPRNAPLSSLVPVILKTGGWFFIILRVFGYCVKNYYMVRRNAVKRVTTFAGKNASFSAELEAAALLKRSKKG